MAVGVLLVGTLAAAGCSGSPVGPVDASELPLEERLAPDGKTVLRVGSVRFYGDPDVIDVPARAVVGTPLDVYVTTYGGGCVRQDTTVGLVDGLRATVVPYQRVLADPNAVCTADLRIERRSVQLTFLHTGTATVRIIGREEPGGQLFVVERRVAVRQ